MDNPVNPFLEQLRAALAGGASETDRQQAAEACWALLGALDVAPVTAEPPPTPAPLVAEPEILPVPTRLPALAAIMTSPDPLGSLLDAVITKYGGVLPEKMPRRPTLNIPLVDIPGR